MKRFFTTLILTVLVSVVAFADDTESLETVASPQFSVMSDTYQDVQFVELICPTEGAEIYFTLDGSTPNQDSFLYDGNAIVISSSTVLKAVAYANGNSSAVAVAQYVIGGTTGVISNLINALNDIVGGQGTITVNGTAYDVTVEENGAGASAPVAAAPAPKAAAPKKAAAEVSETAEKTEN